MVSLESIFLTAVIDAKEGRDILTADIPNAFIQTEMPPPGEGEDRVVMKITGPLARLLVGLDPETYAKFITKERGQDVLYVLVLKALYGMLMAALLWYNQLKSDLISIPYSALCTNTYKTSCPRSLVINFAYVSGSRPPNNRARGPVIFITTRSSPSPGGGISVCMNTLGISAVNMLRPSCASITVVRNIDSKLTVGEAESSLLNHSLVGLPL